MSPLVAGTRPATSGREALDPGPSRRPGSAVPLSRQPADERVPFTDEADAITPSSMHLMSFCRSDKVPHDLADIHHATRLFGIHLPASGHPSRAPAAGGFAVSPAPRAGTTFYPCRPYP